MTPDLSKDYVLTDEQFDAWCDRLENVDKQEFFSIYGGDTYTLRFVCALDYLTLQKVQFAQPIDMFTAAYYIAAKRFEPNLDIGNPALSNRAIRAWRHDAVQVLFDRVRYRSVRQGSIRVQNKLFTLAEDLADAAQSNIPVNDKVSIANLLVKTVKLVDVQEQAIRAERTKRGLVAAREALAGTSEQLSERELTVLLKAAKSQLGTQKFAALVSNVDEQHPSQPPNK